MVFYKIVVVTKYRMRAMTRPGDETFPLSHLKNISILCISGVHKNMKLLLKDIQAYKEFSDVQI